MPVGNSLTKLKRFLTDPKQRFAYLAVLGVFNGFSDETYLKMRYKREMNRPLNLEHPTLYTEKLNWLKLYDRRPEYVVMADKVKAKEYVAEKFGAQYIIPTLGVWEDPEEIDFDALPEQFVLKCNHNSGTGMCICKDKKALDIPKVKKELRRGLKENYYKKFREWPYKNIPRRILAEQYMVDESGVELRDYKVHCFNGEPRLMEYHRGRFAKHNKHYMEYYDMQCKRTDFRQEGYEAAPDPLKKPECWDDMIEKSRVLAQEIPYLRVDWYFANGQLYFGEMTFYDGAGFSPFVGEQEALVGSWLQLPQKTNTI